MYSPEIALLLLALKGALVGLVIAIPIGPTCLLLIRRTIVSGFAGGISIGLGAALADAVYGAVAAYGLTLVGDFLVNYKDWVSILGFSVLLTLGIIEWRATPPDPLANNPTDPKTLFAGFVGSFSVTFFNPITLFSMTAVMASFGVLGHGTGKLSDPVYGQLSIALFVVAVFIGSLVWWILMAAITKFIKSRLSQAVLIRLSRFSAILLIAFGFYILTHSINLGAGQTFHQPQKPISNQSTTFYSRCDFYHAAIVRGCNLRGCEV